VTLSKTHIESSRRLLPQTVFSVCGNIATKKQSAVTLQQKSESTVTLQQKSESTVTLQQKSESTVTLQQKSASAVTILTRSTQIYVAPSSKLIF
jgi:hypothetical protein